MFDLLIPVVLPLAIILATMGIMFLVFQIWRHKVQKRNSRSPLTRKMLRSPGETLREEIEELDTESTFVVIMTFMAPFLIYSITLSQIYFSSNPNLSVSWAGSVLITAGALFFSSGGFLQTLEHLEKSGWEWKVKSQQVKS